MWVHRFSNRARLYLPDKAFTLVKRLGTAVLTPFVFSIATGHFRSALCGRAVDRHGNPLPWYSYPMIEFLASKDFHNRRVLEWGAGQSTLWWAGRAAEIVSFEDELEWYERLCSQGLSERVKLYYVPTSTEGCERWIENTFDVIVIDGLNRQMAAEKSINWLSSDGALLLDNSDGYWGKPGTYPIIDLFRNAGFYRLDFYGFYPSWISVGVTSLFFKDRCFLLEGKENPVPKLVS